MNSVAESKPITLSDAVVRCYQYMAMDQLNTGVIVDDGCCEFMFIKEKGVQIKTGKGALIDLPPCFAFGRVPIPFKFVFPKTLTMFAIKLQPWVASFFMGEEMTGIHGFSSLGYPAVSQLWAQIFQATNFKQMIQHSEDYFSKLEMPMPEQYEISKKICEAIHSSQGLVKTGELIKQFPHSRQKVNRLFLKQTKNSIKEYAIYVRIRTLVKYKTSHPSESLTSIAHRFEYFDQSHFIKDFKKVTGLKPLDFFAKQNLNMAQMQAFA